MKHFQLLLINLSLLLASVLAAPYEIPLHRRSALPAPTELRQWLEKAAADPQQQQQQYLAMPHKGKCPFRDMPSLKNLMDKRVGKESSMGSESPLNDFVDTFLVAEVSFGTPAQTFNMILDSTMFVMYGVPANFLIDSKTCPEGQGLPCENMRLFNMEKSTSFHKILSVKNYTLASDVMRLGNVEAKGKFMLLNGVNFVGQNSFDLIYNSGALNIPRLDGIFSMAFSSQFMPLSSGMEYLLQDQSSKVATIYIEPLTALDFFAAQTGMVTVGGLDTQRCAHNWEWVNVPLMAQRWQIPLSSVNFASHSFGGGNAFFSTFHTFIYGPRESLAPILDLVKPVGHLDGKVPKDVVSNAIGPSFPISTSNLASSDSHSRPANTCLM